MIAFCEKRQKEKDDAYAVVLPSKYIFENF